MGNGSSITDVHCPKCGAPAEYNIIRGSYKCGFCGSTVELGEAMAEKQGFRKLQQEKIRKSSERYRLMRASCSGCGAEIVFDESEAMSNCAFCGRALVRKDYIQSEDMPEMILPFRITREEAAECLNSWCRKNSEKAEAKHLSADIGALQSFYLPYELIRGPVTSRVSRMDSSRVYTCGGYVDKVFVNASRQLDNLLLDAMEPFELEDLKPFNFAYAAGQRIKIRDADAKELSIRVDEEISNDYTPLVRKTLETKKVEVSTNAASVLRMPVLLPVCYLQTGETAAAVNGQTGKVSVRAEKESHYYFLPWWLKALIAVLVFGGIAFAAFRLFGMDPGESLVIIGCLAAFFLIVFLCAYSDSVHNKFRVESGREIFTSTGGVLRRQGKELVRDGKDLKKDVADPVFFERLDGKIKPVQLGFSSLPRAVKTAVTALVVLFLPVIIALFLNGFDFGRLQLGGSAVWFCIMVPVVPVYLLKFSVIERYERPWIYVISEDGSKKRWRKKTDPKEILDFVKMFLKALFIPPACFAIWFGIICFFMCCFLTAFGFD